MLDGLNLELEQLIRLAVLLVISYLLALPIGWNREKKDRSAGLRTFPLVSVAACAYMLVGVEALHDDNAHSRVIYGIITGIGFIGGGAILKNSGGVHGTATAASIWNMGALGIAVAWRQMEIALLLSLINFLTLYFVGEIKTALKTEADPTPEPNIQP